MLSFMIEIFVGLIVCLSKRNLSCHCIIILKTCIYQLEVKANQYFLQHADIYDRNICGSYPVLLFVRQFNLGRFFFFFLIGRLEECPPCIIPFV
jgi:hypothetical protein